MSEAIAAVVFDLDGVLVDSEAFLDTARREIVVWNGGHWQADATRAMMGMSSPDWSRYLHDQLGVPLEPKQINELVVAALARSIRPPAAVARSGRGGQTARGPLVAWTRIVGEVIDAMLERPGITDCFAITVSGEEVAAGKPAPDVYLAATRRLGVDPADAAAVEDSTNGLRGGCRGGNGRDR